MLRRLSEASATWRMCSGRLLRPCQPGLPSRLRLKPNLVAMTTLSRTDESALPTRIFVGEGAVDFSGVEEGNAAVDGGVEKRDHVSLFWVGQIGKAHAHAAEAEGGDFKIGGT